jgi:sulfur-oxidizing protein SoxY
MLNRRGFILGTGAGALSLVPAARAAAAGERLAAEVALFAAGAEVVDSPFGFTMEPYVESGYTVPLAVAPAGLRPGERIEALRILAPANPLVRVASVRFGPSTDGTFSTRIRLARSQTVTALARTDGGRVLRQDRSVEVLVGGCGFDVEETPG